MLTVKEYYMYLLERREIGRIIRYWSFYLDYYVTSSLLCSQFDKNSTEMEEYVMMKQQLQEKEEVINNLQTQLSQTQAEQAAQVGPKASS